MTNIKSPETLALERWAAVMALPEAKGCEELATLLFPDAKSSVAEIQKTLTIARAPGAPRSGPATDSAATWRKVVAKHNANGCARAWRWLGGAHLFGCILRGPDWRTH